MTSNVNTRNLLHDRQKTQNYAEKICNKNLIRKQTNYIKVIEANEKLENTLPDSQFTTTTTDQIAKT